VGGVSNASLQQDTTTGAMQWVADPFEGSGTVTLTRVTSTAATGTFLLTLVPLAGTGASGNKVVTNGVFNVTFWSALRALAWPALSPRPTSISPWAPTPPCSGTPRAHRRHAKPSPGELLFEFVVGPDRYRCELRDHGDVYGVEAQFFLNGDLERARTFASYMVLTHTAREHAIHWAEQERQAGAGRMMTDEGNSLIGCVGDYVNIVFEQLDLWHQNRPPHQGRPEGESGIQPWFRGEPVVDDPLLPKLYRRPPPYNENALLYHFRNMAAIPNLKAGIDREATDLWLYLARHAGLPTRLLDWTEGALTALYFAVREHRPARVWMLVPQALNIESGLKAFETPWKHDTLVAAAIRAAWGDGGPLESDLPIALYPMHVHPRLQVQQSCFTIHGRRPESLRALMAERGHSHFLRALDIDPTRHRSIAQDLRILGISQASLFPDLDGLAADLTAQFWGASDGPV
jgi:FRG domain